MEDGLRHRANTPLSDSEILSEPEEIETQDSMVTTCKWCPLMTITGVLIYMHGIALGWYLCSK